VINFFRRHKNKLIGCGLLLLFWPFVIAPLSAAWAHFGANFKTILTRVVWPDYLQLAGWFSGVVTPIALLIAAMAYRSERADARSIQIASNLGLWPSVRSELLRQCNEAIIRCNLADEVKDAGKMKNWLCATCRQTVDAKLREPTAVAALRDYAEVYGALLRFAATIDLFATEPGVKLPGAAFTSDLTKQAHFFIYLLACQISGAQERSVGVALRKDAEDWLKKLDLWNTNGAGKP
jgi:hypothetical protein